MNTRMCLLCALWIVVILATYGMRGIRWQLPVCCRIWREWAWVLLRHSGEALFLYPYPIQGFLWLAKVEIIRPPLYLSQSEQALIKIQSFSWMAEKHSGQLYFFVAGGRKIGRTQYNTPGDRENSFFGPAWLGQVSWSELKAGTLLSPQKWFRIPFGDCGVEGPLRELIVEDERIFFWVQFENYEFLFFLVPLGPAKTQPLNMQGPPISSPNSINQCLFQLLLMCCNANKVETEIPGHSLGHSISGKEG